MAEIRAGTTYVTPTQYYELMAQKALRRQAFLQAEAVTVKTLGAPAPILAKAAGIYWQYGAIVTQQSYGDAVLITYGQITDMEIVTMESRLSNFVQQVPRRVRFSSKEPGARPLGRHTSAGRDQTLGLLPDEP